MKNFNNIFIRKEIFYFLTFSIAISFQMSIRSSTPKPMHKEIFNTLLFEEVTTQSLSSFGALQKCGDNGLDVCVPYYNCDPVTNTVLLPLESDNHNRIDIRSDRPCDHFLDVCCDIVRIIISPPIHFSNRTNSSTHTETSTLKKVEDVSSPTVREEESEPSENSNCGNWSICGMGNPNGISFKLSGNMHNIAQYGEFPWQVLLLKTSHRGRLHTDEIICGGSIIQQNIVLTSAHCVTGFSPSEITVRAGEWDIQTTIESISYQDRISKKIVIHECYTDNLNDIALIFLDRPFIKVKSVGSICLPNTKFPMKYDYCYASGWGSYNMGGQKFNPVMLKKIKLMMISHSECQKSMRETGLGSEFILDPSLTCAKGGKEINECGGDGGGPIVCFHPSNNNMGHYIQIGIISKGLGCNISTSVDVYTDITEYTTWIKQKMEMFRQH